MDCERRDRRGGASPSRDARAALLSRIAEKRAAKATQSTVRSAQAAPLPESSDVTIQSAHATPLPESPSDTSVQNAHATPLPESPSDTSVHNAHGASLLESDESGSSEAEEFYTPDKPDEKAAAQYLPNYSSLRNSAERNGDRLGDVLGSLERLSLSGSSRLPESSSEPNCSGSTAAVREPLNGQSVNDILDSLGDLSLTGSSRSSESSLNSNTIPTVIPKPAVRETFSSQHMKENNNGNLQRGLRQSPVDLSSDEEDVFQPTKQRSWAPSSAVDSSLKADIAPKVIDVNKERDHDWSKNGEGGDIVLGEGANKYVLSAKIANRLYTHQQSGIRWLWGLHLKKMGGILGDDMGLGKTMQIAAFFAGLFQSKLIRTAMVVAPKTLISHWVNELSNVGLGRKTYSFVDSSSRVRDISLVKVLQMGGVLLTTYDMVRCNWMALRGDKHGRDGYGDTGEDIITWDYIVLDEGHLIKNPSTERAKSLRELPSAHRIIISGTPIQNNLKEMWALMDFCCPGLLGDHKEFKSKYESQIVAGNDKFASNRMKRLGVAVAQELRQKLAPFFLRRMKSEVFPEKAESAEAPKLSRKNDFIVWLKLTNRQEQLYRAFLESDAVFNALQSSKALTALSVLKKICDHPCLLTKRAADDIAEGMEGILGNEDRIEAEQMTASLAGLVGDVADFERDTGAASVKIAFVLILLEKLKEEGHRTLIFSQTRKMLNIIQGELQERHWNYCRIDGTMKSADRAYAVDNFQSNPDIPFFLLTSQVGGLGLTLTAADRVVIIDPAWNPSVDNQSVDRAYRIGQTKDVAVYRLMTCGTIEEKIYRKQVFKGGLMKIATETKNQMRYFSQQELHDLFRVPETGFSVSATQMQMAEEHFGEHQTSSDLEEHITYLEGLSMIAGVSHHDLLYSKAAPELPPPVDDQDDTKVTWEPRNPIYNPKPSKPASKVQETYTYDPANAAGPKSSAYDEIYDEEKHAYLRVDYFKDKIARLAAMLEDEDVMSKLMDGGAKIIKKIKEHDQEMKEFQVKAAKFKERLSSSEGLQKRGESQRGRVQAEVIDLGRERGATVLSPVKIRSASGNNIYTNTQVGNDFRKKPQGPVPGVNQSLGTADSLEGGMGTLRV